MVIDEQIVVAGSFNYTQPARLPHGQGPPRAPEQRCFSCARPRRRCFSGQALDRFHVQLEKLLPQLGRRLIELGRFSIQFDANVKPQLNSASRHRLRSFENLRL